MEGKSKEEGRKVKREVREEILKKKKKCILSKLSYKEKAKLNHIKQYNKHKWTTFGSLKFTDLCSVRTQ